MSENKIYIPKTTRAKIMAESNPNTAPIGTIRFHKYNESKFGNRTYAMIKTEKGWEPYGNVLFGDRVDGMVAIPLDMNQKNLDPENWILIPKKLNGTMGKLKLWSTDPEITKTGLKLCELIQAMRKQEKENANG